MNAAASTARSFGSPPTEPSTSPIVTGRTSPAPACTDSTRMDRAASGTKDRSISPMGLALSPHGDALFVVESFRPGISRIPIRHDGAAGAAEPVVTLPGTVPDGIAFGPDGLLYVGCYEPSQVLQVDVSNGLVSTVLADPTAQLLCHPHGPSLPWSGTIHG